MKTLPIVASLVCMSMLCACGRSSPPPASKSAAAPAPANARFVGKMWISNTPGAARGSFVVFLPDETMLMGSCVETYRLSVWGVAGDKIRWLEDTIPIEAEVELPRHNELVLRIAGQERALSYVTAAAPYVCPDLPR